MEGTGDRNEEREPNRFVLEPQLHPLPAVCRKMAHVTTEELFLLLSSAEL